MYVLNTTVNEYFNRITLGQLALPHYQRLWAWSRPMVCEFFRAILLNRPVGALLTYDVPPDDPLEARPINNAPALAAVVNRYLLDGQQRLTSLYMGLTNTHERDNCRFFVDLSGEEPTVSYSTSQAQWLDNPEECLERRCFPLPLFSPDAEAERTQFYMNLPQHAGGHIERNEIITDISGLATNLRNHQIPELVLENTVPPDIALDVFVKMNTNNSDLDAEDIAVAMVALREGNLREYFGELEEQVPNLVKVVDLPWSVLATAALVNELKPSAPVFRGDAIANFLANDDSRQVISEGLAKAVSILRTLKVYNARMLPTKTVIPLLAALWVRTNHGQQLGAQEIANADDFLRRVFWFAALSSRYDRQSNARVLADFIGITDNIGNVIARNWDQIDAPIFSAPLPSVQEIADAGFPTGSSRLGKGVFLVTLQQGAPAPLTGVGFDADIDQDGLPDYHHFFPRGWAESNGIDRQVYNTAMNCVFLQPLANREVQQRSPRDYILNCNGNPPGWACTQDDGRNAYTLDEDRLESVRQNLVHHLIPVDCALAEIGGDDEEEIARRAAAVFGNFLLRRAELVYDTIGHLVD